MDDLCKDNIICCDDDCKRCAQLIYQRYLILKRDNERLKTMLALVDRIKE